MMDTPFIYDRFVTGKNFVGRRTECSALKNLLGNRENVCIYEPPKTGKKSVVQQVLFSMRISGARFTVAQADLFNVRTVGQFLQKFGSAVIRATASTPDEYSGIIGEMLEGTHFVFDQEKFSLKDEVISIDGEPDMNDIRKLTELPRRIAESRDIVFFIILDEFSSLLNLGETEYEGIFRALYETVRSTAKTESWQVSHIFMGSKVNAMKHIFEKRRYFYREVEHLPLHKIGARELTDHIVRGFLTWGKVIEQDLAAGAVNLFDSNIWYLNHFFSICDSLSKGYMNEGILMDALEILISIHRHRFMSMTDDLSVHQLSLLKAVLDGEARFSSADVIEKYRLNSSANVRRVKDALTKKEIITFDEKEEPVILDPLYKYWLEKYYLI